MQRNEYKICIARLILKLSTLRFGKTSLSSTTAVADKMVCIYKTSKVVGVWVITKIQRFNNSPIIPRIFKSSFRRYFEWNIVTIVYSQYLLNPQIDDGDIRSGIDSNFRFGIERDFLYFYPGNLIIKTTKKKNCNNHAFLHQVKQLQLD